jgi:hypothetical protein
VLPIPRLDFLHNLSLLVLIVLSLCQALYQEVYSNYLAWLLIGYGLSLIIGGLGLLKHSRLPKLTLKPAFIINTVALFNFAFRVNSRYHPSEIRKQYYVAPQDVLSEQLHLQ